MCLWGGANGPACHPQSHGKSCHPHNPRPRSKGMKERVGGTSPHGCVSMLFGNIVPTPPGIYPFPTVVMPIALSGAMITPSSNKCVASPRGDTGGRWQSEWPCHSLKYRDRSRVHSDSLALTSVYRCHTV